MHPYLNASNYVILTIFGLILIGCDSPQPSGYTQSEIHERYIKIQEEKNQKKKQYIADLQMTLSDSAKLYKLFKVHIYSDKFKGVKELTTLNPPIITHAGHYDGFVSEENKKQGVKLNHNFGEFGKSNYQSIPISEAFIYMEERRAFFSSNSMALWAFKDSAMDTSYLYITTPSTPLSETLRLGGVNFTRHDTVRDDSANKYNLKNVASNEFKQYQMEVTIPTSRLIKSSETEQPITFRFYGRGIIFEAKLPSWYTKAYLFALMKQGWVKPEKISNKLADEFKKISSSPSSATPEVPANETTIK